MFRAIIAVICLGASTAWAVDLRTELGGQDIIRRVNYEWTSQPPTPPLPEVTAPEEILIDPVPDGIVMPEHAIDHGGMSCGPGGCAPACGPACGGCSLCCTTGCWWGGVEFINWWRRSGVAPALVTDGPLPDAEVFAGESRLFDESQVGMRLTLGWWGNACQSWGLLGRWYLLQDAEYNFQDSSNGEVVISRPFFNLSVNDDDQIIGNDALDVALDNPGSINIRGKSTLQGGDLLLRYTTRNDCCGSRDFLMGYTTALIDDDLFIRSVSMLDGVDVEVTDLFATQNRFHGATFGMLSQTRFECVTFEMLGKFSFGSMEQIATVAGTFDGEPNGLLAQPNNSGVFSQDVFVVAPELGLNMIYHPTPCLDINVGYSFLYWSSVAQATDLIDPLLRVNPNNPPGEFDWPHPDFEFRNSDYFVHGLNVGLRFSY